MKKNIQYEVEEILDPICSEYDVTRENWGPVISVECTAPSFKGFIQFPEANATEVMAKFKELLDMLGSFE